MSKTRSYVMATVAVVVLALALLLVSVSPIAPAIAQGITNFDSVVLGGDLIVGDDATVTDDLTVSGALVAAGGITTDVGDESVGSLPTVASASIEFTDTVGIFTVADGEIWIVHNVLIEVTEDYDCTGDNCTLQIGDGNDPNGLLDLVDAELQAADTEVTGGAAGWQGQLSGTLGAYLADASFVYAPSGAAETIDLDVGGTTPVGGEATVYIIYTRIQ